MWIGEGVGEGDLCIIRCHPIQIFFEKLHLNGCIAGNVYFKICRQGTGHGCLNAFIRGVSDLKFDRSYACVVTDQGDISWRNIMAAIGSRLPHLSSSRCSTRGPSRQRIM